MRRGFTLIELITTLGVGVLMLAALVQIFLGARAAFETGSENAELAQNGRIALERISRDLKQADELITRLPITESDPQFPPPAQVEFQDGHDSATLTYIRYHLSGNGLYRELAYYALASAPGVHVRYDDRDDDGSAAIKTVTENELIAEYMSALLFWGQNPITVSMILTRDNTSTAMRTTLYGRNLH